MEACCDRLYGFDIAVAVEHPNHSYEMKNFKTRLNTEQKSKDLAAILGKAILDHGIL